MKNLITKYIAAVALLFSVGISMNTAKGQTVLFSDNMDPLQPGWLLNRFGPLPVVNRNDFYVIAPVNCLAPNNSITNNSLGILVETPLNVAVQCGYTNTPSASTGYEPIVFRQFNTVGYQNINLEYYFKCNGGASGNDFGRLMYSFDGSNFFPLVTDFNFGTGTFIRNVFFGAAFNNTTFYIGWTFRSDVSIVTNPPHIFDNVVLRGTAICVPPTVTCPGNQSASAGANCTANVSYNHTATGTAPVNVSYTFSGATSGSGSGNGSGSTFNLGTTTVTLTATNACGTSSCSFTVTVTDNTPPTISCPGDQTLVLDGNCAGTLPDYRGMATAADNCSVSVSQSPAAGSSVSGVGTTNVTLTATDGSGNTANCNFNVNRVDNTPPSITCPPDQSFTCNSDVPAPNTGSVSSSDACGPTVVTHVRDDVSGAGCAGDPRTVTRTYRATDQSGNTSECTQTFTVNPTAVTVTCPANVTVYRGWPPLDCATLSPTVSGGCPPYTYAWSNGPTTLSQTVCPTTTTTYTLVATDANGCTGYCMVTVCVNDVRCGNNLDKITICHFPPGNPANAQTLCIAAAAVPTHLSGHTGDHLGACGTNVPCVAPGAQRMGAPEATNNDALKSGELNAFPNPFDLSTTLKFTLDTDVHAALNVYDVSGRVIAKLFEGDMSAGNVYSSEFKPEGMASGVFIARLETSEGVILSQKLMFIK